MINSIKYQEDNVISFNNRTNIRIHSIIVTELITTHYIKVKNAYEKKLLVDDDKHIRRLFTEELEDEGYQVVTASNGHEAISSVLRSEHPDLMIMDLHMPKMDGLDTIGNMLKLKIDVPAIIYTAYLSYKKNYLAMAADAYVMKSSDLTELKDKVHQLINAHDKDNEKILHSYKLQANMKR